MAATCACSAVFFLLFVEALSFVEPVSGVLGGDARGRGRAGHLSGDRGVEFVGWGVQVGQWQLGADEGLAECGDGGLVFLRCVVGGVSSLRDVADERRFLRSGPAVELVPCRGKGVLGDGRCAVASERVPHRGQLCPAVAGQRIELIGRLLCADACLAGFSERAARLASSLVEAVEFGDELGNLLAAGLRSECSAQSLLALRGLVAGLGDSGEVGRGSVLLVSESGEVGGGLGMFGACCGRGCRCVGSGFAQCRELCAPGGAFSGGPPGEGVPGGNEISGVDHRGAEAGDGVPASLECRSRGAAALIEVEAVPVEGAACGAGAARRVSAAVTACWSPRRLSAAASKTWLSLRCGVGRPGEVAAGGVRRDRGAERG